MNIALVLAAGSGVRMNQNEPKQFIKVFGKPLLVYSLSAFQNNPHIDVIVIVTNKEYLTNVNELCNQYDLNKVKFIIAGGATRQESVYNGLKGIQELEVKDDDNILIHDSARPLVSQKIIDDNIKALESHDAVSTVIGVNDTIIRSEKGEKIDDVSPRKEFYQAQTPQSFKFSLILKAHENAYKNKTPDITDDAKIVLLENKDVYLVEGDKENFKITTPLDMKILETILKEKAN